MMGRCRGRENAALLALAFITFAISACTRTPSAEAKPQLLFLSGLPLLFGEEFSIGYEPPPLIQNLNRAYKVTAIATTAPEELKKGRTLVMIQPRAQAAENLVALDQWVRDGGRLLLFADPRLEWESAIPLGDVTRPPPSFADTGLLAHWGLRLDAPDRPGKVAVEGADGAETYFSPGTLVKTGGDCRLLSEGVIAECTIGKGFAIVVADADLLDNRTSGGEGGEEPSGRLLSLVHRLGPR